MVFAGRRHRLYGKNLLPNRKRNAARSGGFGLRRLFLTCAAIILALVLAPYVIAPFYRSIEPVSTPMLWRWATGQRVARIVVPLYQIARPLPLTVILAEDASFCHNHGIDLSAIRDALQQSDEDVADARGASTITQQLAKNLFLWPGHSVVRKVLEFPLAIWLTLVLPKRRIAEIYLNVAEWGPNGEFGAEAGARWAFGIPARDLDAEEAAELTAILPNPIERSARHPSVLIRQLAALYVRRAADHPAQDACLYARQRGIMAQTPSAGRSPLNATQNR
jgi:monofunctional biosynthetic peptidoglycan transglycosylase